MLLSTEIEHYYGRRRKYAIRKRINNKRCLKLHVLTRRPQNLDRDYYGPTE